MADWSFFASTRTSDPLVVPVRNIRFCAQLCAGVAPVFHLVRLILSCSRMSSTCWACSTLNWPLLDRWHQSPGAFGEADFAKLRNSGIDIFHPTNAFEQGSGYEVTRAWFTKWNRFIEWHPDYFVRVDGAKELTLASEQKKIGIILGMQDANHLRSVDDVDEFISCWPAD